MESKKIHCDTCKIELSQGSLARHRKTDEHQKLIKKDNTTKKSNFF